MSRRKKLLIALAALLLALPVGAVSYLLLAFPRVEAAQTRHVTATPSLIARGRYLAEHVTACVNCHSRRDWGRFSAPPEPETVGAGGESFTDDDIGVLHAPNITPSALASWTDGELMRAITSGVNRDGDALFPVMPYAEFRHLCRDDVDAIVAYVRQLPPRPNQVFERDIAFPLSLLMRTFPAPADPWPCPSPGTPEYGKYLTTVAGCPVCHTPADKGRLIPGREFSGGRAFPLGSGGQVLSANISPDPRTGIGSWSKERFLARFRAYADTSKLVPVSANQFNTIMPWSVFAGMTDQDLGAIYDYLMTQKPIAHAVVPFTPPGS